MVRVFAVFFFCFTVPLFSQNLSGIITDEEQNPLSAVLVFNVQSEKKSYSNIKGEFTIEANANDELRFVRYGFERNSKKINSSDFNNPISISLFRKAEEIEEVKVTNLNLSGDLNKDSRKLTKVDKVAQLQREIGVPLPPEKPREKPSELGKNVLLPLIGIPPTADIQAIYNVLSGKARKQKSWYKYEDLQDKIKWIRSKVPDEYFTKMNIPEEKISEFLQFSIGVQPEISKGIKARNLSKVLFALEETFPKYLNR